MISLAINEWSLPGVDSVAEGDERQELLNLTAEIVASFAGNNTVAVGGRPAVIASVFQALRGVGQGEAGGASEAPGPAVSAVAAMETYEAGNPLIRSGAQEVERERG